MDSFECLCGIDWGEAMKAQEVRKLIGKVVQYKSNLSRRGCFPIWCGGVMEVFKTEVLINGDWHDIKTLEIIEVIENHH